MSLVAAYLLANVFVASIGGSAAALPTAAASAAESGSAPASPLHSPGIGASAKVIRAEATPHADFGAVDDALAGLQADLASRVMRRQREPTEPISAARRLIEAGAAAGRQNLMRSDSDNSEEQHVQPYQENAEFTPEAIFANKQLAPDVAEFLGHLAQRSRVHHKDVSKPKEAGLLAEARVSPTKSADEDDSDDMEDMKRAAASNTKATPLAHFLNQLDSKATAASWNANECRALSANISAKYAQLSGRSQASWGTVGPVSAAGRAEIHTGMFFRHWSAGKSKEAARKLRLGVLSFLATQDAAKVKLHIWTDLDQNHHTLKDMLGPIAHHPEFMDAIQITTFDPKKEFEKVPPTLAKLTLAERYKKDSMPNLRPDLFRSVILYNYGGMWMDADTVLMQDVAPLLGEDWAHLVRGKEGAIEGALLSASKPQSHFTNEYLISVVMREPPLFEEKQKPILEEIFGNDPAHTSMHVLPPCFLDSDPLPATSETAVLSSESSLGSSFFGNVVAEPYRAYFSSGIQDALKDKSPADVSVLQDSSFFHLSAANQEQEEPDEDETPTSPSWAYHWRGNFAAPWARGSLADVVERTFMKKLRIKYQH